MYDDEMRTKEMSSIQGCGTAKNSLVLTAHVLMYMRTIPRNLGNLSFEA